MPFVVPSSLFIFRRRFQPTAMDGEGAAKGGTLCHRPVRSRGEDLAAERAQTWHGGCRVQFSGAKFSGAGETEVNR
jgi:hypothetical protein